MVRATATGEGLLKTQIWYDPRFHFDVGIGDTRVPSESDEIRVESANGTTLAFEFSTESRLMTGFLCLTFSGRAHRGNAIDEEVLADAVIGRPLLSFDADRAELVYARPASSRNVFATAKDVAAIIPSETRIQFLFGSKPTRLIRVSEQLTVGTCDSFVITFVELSGVPSEATANFLNGSGASCQ